MNTKKTLSPKAPAKRKSNQERMLARVESVRMKQREERHFDCFGRAASGYCDQGRCMFHAECLSISRLPGVVSILPGPQAKPKG